MESSPEHFINEEYLDDDSADTFPTLWDHDGEDTESHENVISEDCRNSTPNRSPTDYQFCFKATFHRKLFRSQLRVKEFCTKNVFGDTVDCVLRAIWETAKLQIIRKVEFVDETPAWCEEGRPTYSDINDYVILQDQTKKRVYPAGAVTSRVMQAWRDRIVKVFVYVYSTNVETNAQHQKLLRTLITPQNPDRSGAHSTRDDTALANDLRKNHPDIEGHYSSWLLWANFINSAPAHDRDQMKEASSPPLELSKYFRWTSVSESARLQAMHRGMVVANVVNDGWSKQVAEMEKDLALALSILQSISSRLSAMKARGEAGMEWFTAMETALQPEETELSRNLSSKVTDCEDVDHAHT